MRRNNNRQSNAWYSSAYAKSAFVFVSTLSGLMLARTAELSSKSNPFADNARKRDLASTQQAQPLITAIEAGRLTIPGTITDLEIQGNYAFLAAQDAGLQIVDVSDKNNPFIVGNYSTPAKVHEVEVVGNYAYLAEDFYGLTILDISVLSTFSRKQINLVPLYLF